MFLTLSFKVKKDPIGLASLNLLLHDEFLVVKDLLQWKVYHRKGLNDENPLMKQISWLIVSHD